MVVSDQISKHDHSLDWAKPKEKTEEIYYGAHLEKIKKQIKEQQEINKILVEL